MMTQNPIRVIKAADMIGTWAKKNGAEVYSVDLDASRAAIATKSEIVEPAAPAETPVIKTASIDMAFVKAGKAVFTVDNGKGKHYTFRVQSGKDKYRAGKTAYFVKLLTGSNNEQDYTFIGLLSDADQFINKSYFSSLKPAIAVLEWALKMIQTGKELPAGYAIEHAGHCGRCARLLTTPRSLQIGIGPECEKKMGA